jgi:hypothetical protein
MSIDQGYWWNGTKTFFGPSHRPMGQTSTTQNYVFDEQYNV